MTEIPEEAVEAAARALTVWDVAEPSGRRLCVEHTEWLSDADLCASCIGQARAALTAAAPHIVAQATADVRAGIEALRNEWQAQSERLDGAPPAFGGPDEYARGSSAAYDGCADALDALLGGA